MIRDDLLKKICPWGTCDCGDDYESCNCDGCKRIMNEWLDKYDKQIRADAIDEFADLLVEQGILGSRCISDGEITDYGKVYAKKYKEQLKAGGKNE